MPNYIVDPTRFHAEGAIVNWAAATKRLGLPAPVDSPAGAPLFTTELRWIIQGALGMPTEPFQVWSRPHSTQDVAKTLTLAQVPFLFAFDNLVVVWNEGSMSSVTATQAPVAGSVWAFAGAPLLSNLVAFAAITAGTTNVSLAAPIIEGLIFTAGIAVTSVLGVETGALTQAAGWKPIELVGLPVKLAAWACIGKHGQPQGIVGSFTDAQTAAVARLRRAAPPSAGRPLWLPASPPHPGRPLTPTSWSTRSTPTCSTS